MPGAALGGGAIIAGTTFAEFWSGFWAGANHAASFVIVTGAVLGVGLVGWRVAVGVRSNRAGS